MLDNALAALVSFFLIDPLQAGISDRLAAAGVPPAIAANVASCARTATPGIVDRATGDIWWTTSTAFALWTGSTTPDAVLVAAAPVCAPAVDAARPFLAGRPA